MNYVHSPGAEPLCWRPDGELLRKVVDALRSVRAGKLTVEQLQAITVILEREQNT